MILVNKLNSGLLSTVQMHLILCDIFQNLLKKDQLGFSVDYRLSINQYFLKHTVEKLLQ